MTNEGTSVQFKVKRKENNMSILMYVLRALSLCKVVSKKKYLMSVTTKYTSIAMNGWCQSCSLCIVGYTFPFCSLLSSLFSFFFNMARAHQIYCEEHDKHAIIQALLVAGWKKNMWMYSKRKYSLTFGPPVTKLLTMVLSFLIRLSVPLSSHKAIVFTLVYVMPLLTI